MPRHTTKYASAEFFILFAPGSEKSGSQKSSQNKPDDAPGSATSVEDVQFISGEESLRASTDDLRKANFNVPFPQGSQAKLVRKGILSCSVVMKDCMFVLLLPQSTRK